MSRSRTAITLLSLSIATLTSSPRALAQDDAQDDASEARRTEAATHAADRRSDDQRSVERASQRYADPRRTPVDPMAAAIGGGAAALTLGVGVGIYLAPPTQHSPEAGVWRGGIVADEPFRDLMRAGSPDGMALAGHISDGLLVGTIAYTALVDALLIPLVQGDPDLAWQASIAHSLAFGITLSLGGVVKRVAGRARPYERQCANNPDAPGCSSGDVFESFYSLHTGLAATSAGVSCALHLERNLYGDQAADITSCGASIAAATMTGLLRVVSDRHYLSDVLIGGLLGFLVGYVVPLFVVPSRPQVAAHGETHEEHSEARSDFSWTIMPTGGGGDAPGAFSAGVAVTGTF